MTAPDFPSDTRIPPRREDHYVLEELPARERMLFGALAYACFPVALYYARWDPFVRFHARQATGLAIGWALAWLFSSVTWSNEVPELGALGYFAITLLSCHGIYHALSLQMRPVKFVGRYLDKLPLPKKLAEA